MLLSFNCVYFYHINHYFTTFLVSVRSNHRGGTSHTILFNRFQTHTKIVALCQRRRFIVRIAASSVHGRYNHIVFELHEEQRHECQDRKQKESQRCKDLVGLPAALCVFVKGGIQNNILVGQDHKDTEEESNREGCRESFEDKGTEDTESQVYQSRPNSGNRKRDGSISGLLQAHHCKNPDRNGPQEFEERASEDRD